MIERVTIPRSGVLSRTRLVKALTVAILIACVSIGALAQEADPAARPDRGTRPVGSYSISDIESISLQNGNVNLSIPLAALPPIAGGKLSFAVNANYNSKNWDMKSYENAADQFHNGFWTAQQIDQGITGGWRVGGAYAIYQHLAETDFEPVDPGCIGGLACLEKSYRYKMFLITPDGSQHELRPMDYLPGATQNYRIGFYKDTPATTQTKMRYYSLDGSYLWVSIDPYTLAPISWYVYLPDGTHIRQKAGGAQLITDTNGNQIKLFSETDANGVVTTHYQDVGTLTTGTREILTVFDWNTNTGQVKYQTVGGVLETVDIAYGTTHVEELYNIDDRVCPDVMALLFDDIQVIRSITLPQTETLQARKQFVFFYNSDTYTGHPGQDTINLSWRSDCSAPFVTQATVSHGWGGMSEMDTPNGAKVKYSFLFDGNSSLARGLKGARKACGETITQKQIEHDAVTESWSYSIAQGSEANSGSVTGPDGSMTTENFYPHDPALAGSIAGALGKGGLVYKTTRSNRQIVERHWTPLTFNGGDSSSPNGLAPFNPVVDAEYTTLLDPNGNPSKMSAKTMQYDFNGNLVSETDYDWFDPASVTRDPNNQNLPTGVPAGAVALRMVTNSYYNPAATSAAINYAKRDLINITPLIVNAPKEVIIGVSDTQLSYDGQPYETAPTIGKVTNEARSDSPGHFINTTHAYDATYGNLTSTTDPRGNVTQYFYEDLTHALLTKIVVDPNNQVTGDELTTQMAYDYYTGLVMSQTDPNQKTTSTVYTNQLLGTVDPFGRPGIVTDPQGRKAVNRYVDHVLQVEVWSDINSPSDAKLRSRTSADQLGRPIKTESAEDGVNYTIFADAVYQQMGKITITTNPMRAQGASTDGWTRTTKDDIGRIVTVETFNGIYPGGTATGVVTTSYDANATTVTDQASKVRRSIVDGLGRLTRVDEPDTLGSLGLVTAPTQPTNYTYDSRGNLTQVQQGTQLARTFGYDGLSRLKQAFNPESGTINYDYYDNGNLWHKTDSRSVVTTFAYDGLNRIVSRTYSGPAPGGTTPAVTYAYDTLGAGLNGKGRLTSISSSVSSNSYGSYDVMGRVVTGTQTTDGQNYTTGYQYNLAGGMTSEIYPSGRVITTGYDSAGRLASVTGQKSGEPNKTYSSQFTYTPHGAIASVTLGNNLVEATTFNGRLQPTFIKLGTTPNPTSVLQLGDEYTSECQTGNNGNVMRQTITAPGLSLTQDYCYDSLNRLSSASENSGANWSQTYGYDRWGNRWVSASTGYTLSSLTPTLSTHISATNNRLVMGPSHYDLAGNLDIDAQNRTFTYDGENRQITFNTTVEQYFYDGDGRRVKKIDSTTGTTVFVYNVGGQLIAEYHSDPVPSPAGGGGTSYLTSDHLGSTRVVTRADGSVKARYDYLSFGEELGSGIGGRTVALGYSAADSTNQKFTQKERDNESGLDYFGARYYSSAQGRFTTADFLIESARTAKPQSWNRYAYVLNNPIRLIDPDGLEEDDDDKKKPKVVVVVFQGGNLSDSERKRLDPVKANGQRPEGLGEDVIDVESPHIAQQVKNDFPDAQVRLAGPQSTGELTNQLVAEKPDNLIIYGFSAGGIAAVALANNVTDAGGKVDMLFTVDPRTGPLTDAIEVASWGLLGKSAGLRNPSMVGDAVNFYVANSLDDIALGSPIQVKGARNFPIDSARDPSTKINHDSADDVMSPGAIHRIESRLSQIYNKPH
jgi:RHS repeat-associated protein